MPHSWETSWQLGESIGKGGQGLTYRATHNTSGTEAALKKLKDNRSDINRARMHREAATLEVLHATDGANVPRVLEHNTELHSDGTTELYLVTEFIPGPTLAEFVSTKLMDMDRAAVIIKNVAKTVFAAHREFFLHRDLKPDNIILRNDDISDVVLIDYGLSFNNDDEDLTQVGETFRNKFLDLPETNTPGGDRRDFRSDITSLSALLYFCLTGHRIGHLRDSDGTLPHRRSEYSIRRYIEDDIRLIGLESLLDRGLDPSVDNRFQTVDEFLDRLEMVVTSKAEASNDLRTLAQLAYQNIRSEDRAVQVAEMLSKINQSMSVAFKIVSKIGLEITPFRLSVQKVSVNKNPKPYEKLYPDIQQWQLIAPPNRVLRIVCITVGAKGNECVLLTQVLNNVRQLGTVLENEWKECAWFQPDSPDVTETVERAICETIGDILKEYAAIET